jgi:prephenate dehydratase
MESILRTLVDTAHTPIVNSNLSKIQKSLKLLRMLHANIHNNGSMEMKFEHTLLDHNFVTKNKMWAKYSHFIVLYIRKTVLTYYFDTL